MTSSDTQDMQVKKPGSKTLVPFSDLCVTGGVVNAFKAVELAAKTPGKKKANAGTSGGARKRQSGTKPRA